MKYKLNDIQQYQLIKVLEGIVAKYPDSKEAYLIERLDIIPSIRKDSRLENTIEDIENALEEVLFDKGIRKPYGVEYKDMVFRRDKELIAYKVTEWYATEGAYDRFVKDTVKEFVEDVYKY